MIEAHQDQVDLKHSFNEVYSWLYKNSYLELKTKIGTKFEAVASISQKGNHAGEKVIRFFQNKKEFGRAYYCCWGRYYNCNRTRIGMYCTALDNAF